MKNPASSSSPVQPAIALVVGLCSHGLSVVRGLHEAGVEVYALEKDAGLPGVRSNAIRHTFLCSEAEMADLAATLAALRARLPQDRSVVLFPTNDTHVRLVGEGVELLRRHYKLSWADCAGHVLRLQRKNELEQAARSQGLNYPRSASLSCVADETAVAGFRYPVILKPARPLSSFKTALAQDAAELHALLRQYQADLPILAQEYIAGGDQSLYFGALVLDRGAVVQKMVGRKIASFPPARGQTTVAETVDEPEVLALTRQFFAGLEMSGPVSLELKRAPDGSFWVIEPTVGRTDFWLELCIAAGFNQVYQEFQIALGQDAEPGTLRGPVTWFDGERDILAYWKAAISQRSLHPYGGKRPVFTYWRAGDQGPFLRACRMGLATRVRGRLARIKAALSGRRDSGLRVQEFPMDQPLPPELAAWLQAHQPDVLFGSPDWYLALLRFEREAYPEHQGRSYHWLFVWRGGLPCLAVPVERRPGLLRRLDVRLLSNFYSPCVDLFADRQQLSQTASWDLLLQALDQLDKGWLKLSATPVSPLQAEVASAGAVQRGHAAQRVPFSTNYSAHAYDLESYWGQRPSQLRNTIKRKGKALQREAHRFEVVTAPTAQQMEDYWSTYKHSWKMREPSRCFIDWLMDWSAARGYLRLGLLYLDGQVVASQLWLVRDKVAHIFKLAQDRDADRFSPGSLLTGHLIDYVYRHDRVECIDFMLGDDPYKGLWMEQEQPYYTLEVLNQRHLLAPALRCYMALRAMLRPRRSGQPDGLATTVP